MSSIQQGVEVNLVVEGQTEQTFVRQVLAPYMASRSVYLRAALIGRPGHKGGDIRWERASIDIGNFLKQRTETYVSTMFDYFRIDSSWPGYGQLRIQQDKGTRFTARDKALLIETETKQKAAAEFVSLDVERRFIPYIEMHEFEALLFSDTEILARELGVQAKQVAQIIAQYDNPEEINEDPSRAPSKRLEALSPGYRKVTAGISIIEKIGISNLREACSHFDQWLRRLEGLSGGNERV